MKKESELKKLLKEFYMGYVDLQPINNPFPNTPNKTKRIKEEDNVEVDGVDYGDPAFGLDIT